MSTDHRGKPYCRSTGRSFIDESETYRNLIEWVTHSEEERSEIDAADTGQDHIHLHQRATEHILREGGA